ncbi:MAG: hypothetical protein AcusKO_18650 [Acuticoccus sp.]
MTSFAELFEWILRRQNTQMAWGPIQAGHVVGARAEPAFVPNDDYVIVRLASMFLRDSRRLWLKLSPLAHSTVVLSGLRERQTHSAVIGPAQFDELATAAAENNVILNQRLAGPTVWRGGDLDLTAGLFAVPKDQAAVALISTLGDLSALGIPGLDQAKEIAAIVKNGVEGLIGLDGTRPVLGANVSLSDADVTPLILVGIAAPQNSIDFDTLWIKGGRLYEGRSAAALRPYETHDHVLISLERGPPRQDWRGLPDLAEAEAAFSAIFEDPDFAVSDATREKLNDAFRLFDGALRRQEGLTEPDKDRIRGEVSKDLQERMAQLDQPLFRTRETRSAARRGDGTVVDLTRFDFADVAPGGLEGAKPLKEGSLPF